MRLQCLRPRQRFFLSRVRRRLLRLCWWPRPLWSRRWRSRRAVSLMRVCWAVVREEAPVRDFSRSGLCFSPWGFARLFGSVNDTRSVRGSSTYHPHEVILPPCLIGASPTICTGHAIGYNGQLPGGVTRDPGSERRRCHGRAISSTPESQETATFERMIQIIRHKPFPPFDNPTASRVCSNRRPSKRCLLQRI